MDPISALSLSAAILQFVDFGSKIIRTTYNIHQSTGGTTKENLQLTELTKTLHDHQSRLATPQTSSPARSADQKALEELAAKCRDIAANFLKLLDDLKVKVKDKGLHYTWESLRQGCRTVWKKEKIARYEKLLRDITLHVNGRLLSMTCGETSAISEHFDELAAMSEDLRLDLKAALNDVQTQLVAEYTLLGSLPKRIQELLKEARKITSSQRTLQSLLFEEITERGDQIHDAHAKTFMWISEDDATSFKRWLISGDGTFWVSGKAGSGKSTLMKFLVNHGDTKTLLRQWSGTDDLVVASFYFWAAGCETQRSQLGLMKSLLYQILCQCPELIPSVWSSRFDSGKFADVDAHCWTRQELSIAVDSIIARSSLKSNFCFFVDGLDKYADALAGDYDTLIQTLEHLATSSRVKFLRFSRPWNVFKDHYGKHADLKLNLQDLTSVDMLEYAQGLPQSNKRFHRLASREPQALSLANQIRDKAEGVFQWVRLVTQSLKRGLTEHDDTEELERRLARTPSDLTDFFRSIFRNIDENYKE